MREVRKAANDPDFLLKALGEASGELYRLVLGSDPRLHNAKGSGYDEQWSMQAIAFHLHEVETGVSGQIRRIISHVDPPIPHVDLDDIPFEEDYRDIEVEDLLDDFHYERRRTAYQLWDLFPYDWQRSGIHPYRGELTVLQLVRELYQHDLEHLWQAQRMLDEMMAART